MTAQEIIASSLRLCGAIAGSEVPTADEFEDGLAALRDILQNWTTEGLTPFATLDQTFTLVAGVRSYTLGPGATWDGYRPVRLRAITVNGCPVDTTRIDYNAGYPVATVTFLDDWRDASVTLTSEVAFTLPDDSTDELLLPPGYLLALRFALASDLAPEYGMDVRGDIEDKVRRYTADLKRANIKRKEIAVAPEMLQSSSWYLGLP